MFRRNNQSAKRISIIAGVLLMLSGITGVGFVEQIGKFVIAYISDNPYIILTFNMLILIASFGGLAVIIGGVLFGKNQYLPGLILVRLGSGAGFLSLIAHLFLAVYSKNFSIASFLSIGMVGMILSVIAPLYARR